MNRRFFLKSGSIALASIGLSISAPSFLERVVLGNTFTGGKRKTLIAIFQRGAVDGFNMVVPFGERRITRRVHRSRFQNHHQVMQKPRSISTVSLACIRR